MIDAPKLNFRRLASSFLSPLSELGIQDSEVDTLFSATLDTLEFLLSNAHLESLSYSYATSVVIRVNA